MNVLQCLSKCWDSLDYPFLIHDGGELYFSEIVAQDMSALEQIKAGDVVALIGDFDSMTIATLFQLIEKKAILAPLTSDTHHQHNDFFATALVDVVIEKGIIKRIQHNKRHKLIDELRICGHAGLILFSTGTTGEPKAVLHDLTKFLKKFETPRAAYRTINFLLFDHIGGLNTLFHTLFNGGVIIAPHTRHVSDILHLCTQHQAEVLPATPTFLRMMLLSGLIPEHIPPSLKIISYGTERMDQPTLDALCALLPQIDFRQTFGLTELGIMRIKSLARDSLFMKIGGEGVQTRVVDNVLEIYSESRMCGYLNAPSPFDDEGWYNTGDVVEEKDGCYKITGRMNEVINVGGLKFMAAEIERVALQYDEVELVKAEGKSNPITGQHVELTVQPRQGADISRTDLLAYLKSQLQDYMVPKRVRIESLTIGHRFKKG